MYCLCKLDIHLNSGHAMYWDNTTIAQQRATSYKQSKSRQSSNGKLCLSSFVDFIQSYKCSAMLTSPRLRRASSVIRDIATPRIAIPAPDISWAAGSLYEHGRIAREELTPPTTVTMVGMTNSLLNLHLCVSLAGLRDASIFTLLHFWDSLRRLRCYLLIGWAIRRCILCRTLLQHAVDLACARVDCGQGFMRSYEDDFATTSRIIRMPLPVQL
jgi:hypothetical protein